MLLNPYRFAAVAPPSGLSWNPSDTAATILLSSGNSVAENNSNSGALKMTRANTFHNTGSWYAEITVLTAIGTTDLAIGVADDAYPLTFTSIAQAGFNAFWRPNGQVFYNGGNVTSAGDVYGINDVVGVAYNAGTGKVRLYKNGTFKVEVDVGAGRNFAPVGVFDAGALNKQLRLRTSPLYLPSGYTYWG